MAEDPVPLADRIASTFGRLAASANDLNRATDDLAQLVEVLDSSLKKLNIGVPAWVRVAGWPTDDGGYCQRLVGYAKIHGQWGIAIAETPHPDADPYDPSAEVWLFNDAPRSARLQVIEEIPDLLERLVRVTQGVTATITAKLNSANSVIAAVVAASELVGPTKRRAR